MTQPKTNLKIRRNKTKDKKRLLQFTCTDSNYCLSCLPCPIAIASPESQKWATEDPEQRFSKCGPQTNSIRNSWEFARKAVSGTPLQVWIRNSKGGAHNPYLNKPSRWFWRAIAWEPLTSRMWLAYILDAPHIQSAAKLCECCLHLLVCLLCPSSGPVNSCLHRGSASQESPLSSLTYF